QRKRSGMSRLAALPKAAGSAPIAAAATRPPSVFLMDWPRGRQAQPLDREASPPAQARVPAAFIGCGALLDEAPTSVRARRRTQGQQKGYPPGPPPAPARGAERHRECDHHVADAKRRPSASTCQPAFIVAAGLPAVIPPSTTRSWPLT